jgi:type IV secretion system protein VirD4
VQCFANGDQATLDYIARRLEQLVKPFEIRTAFARDSFSQLLMFEGKRPAAAIRPEHEDVAAIRDWVVRHAEETLPER